jgi:hypothetical protein
MWRGTKMQEALFERYQRVAINCLNNDFGLKSELALTKNIAIKLVDWFEYRFPEKIDDKYLDANYFCENIARFVKGGWMFYWDKKSVCAGFAVGLLSFVDCRAYAKHNGLGNDFLASVARLDVS